MKKICILSISDNTVYATSDQETAFDLENLRKKIRGSVSQALGDTALEPVELLAIPLYTLNQEIDVTSISIPLYDEVGLRDWPLVLNFTDFSIAKDVGTGSLYVTAVIKPDTLSRQAIENQFLRDVKLLHYPPVKLFKVSKSGIFKAERIYNGSTDWPGNIRTRQFPLEVQVRNLLLLTEFQAFRLKLAGIGRTANNLQWHDLSLIPRGSRLRDRLSMFRDWGMDGRNTVSSLSEGEMTERQSKTRLGQMCPWLLQFQFKDEWSDLSSQKVEIVPTTGVISRSQKILSLVDKDRTARLLHDSVNYHLQADPAGTSEYLSELLQISEQDRLDPSVRDAVDTLGNLLQNRRHRQETVRRQPRYSDFGLDNHGELQRRTTGPGVTSGMMFTRVNGHGVMHRLPDYLAGAPPAHYRGTSRVDPVMEIPEVDEDDYNWDYGQPTRLGARMEGNRDRTRAPSAVRQPMASYGDQPSRLGDRPVASGRMTGAGTSSGLRPTPPTTQHVSMNVRPDPAAMTTSPSLRLRTPPTTHRLMTPQHFPVVTFRDDRTFRDPRAAWANGIQFPKLTDVLGWQNLSKMLSKYELSVGTEFRYFVEDPESLRAFIRDLTPPEKARFKTNIEHLLATVSDNEEFHSNSFIPDDVPVNPGKIPQLQSAKDVRKYANLLGALASFDLENIDRDMIGGTRGHQQLLPRCSAFHYLQEVPSAEVSTVPEDVDLLSEWVLDLDNLPLDYKTGQRIDYDHITSRFENANLTLPASSTRPSAVLDYEVPAFYHQISRADTWKTLLAVANYLAKDRVQDEAAASASILGPRDFMNAFVFLTRRSDVPAGIFQDLRNVTQQLRLKMEEMATEARKLLTAAREQGMEAEEIKRRELSLALYIVEDPDPLEN